MLTDDEAKALGQLIDKLIWDQPIRSTPHDVDPYAPYIMLYANRNAFLQANKTGLFHDLPDKSMADFVDIAEKIIYDASLWNYTFGLTYNEAGYTPNNENGIQLEAYIGDGRKFADDVYLEQGFQFDTNTISFTLNTPQIDKELTCSVVHISPKPNPTPGVDKPILLSDNVVIIPFGTPFELLQTINHTTSVYPRRWKVVGSGYIELTSDLTSIRSMSITFTERRSSLIQRDDPVLDEPS